MKGRARGPDRLKPLGCWLLLLFWLALSAIARAQQPPSEGTILLVVDERAAALATRVAAELTELGFRVETQNGASAPSELDDETRRAGAFAAIVIGPTAEGHVEITVLDRVTGKTLRRELLGRSLSDPTTRELVALRASELLRASLMEIEAPHPPRGEVKPPPAVVRVASAPETIKRPERRLRLGAESGVLVAPGLSAAPLLQATLGVRAQERLELGLTLGSQLTAAAHGVESGRIETTARWLGIGPRLLLLPRREGSRVALGFDFDFALVGLSASGFATDSSERGQSYFAWSAAGVLGIDSKIRLYKQLWWVLRPGAGLTLRQLSLQANGQEVRLWGRPWLQCSTGLEVEL